MSALPAHHFIYMEQKTSHATIIVGIIIVLAIVVFGAYALMQKDSNMPENNMTQEEDSMMKGDGAIMDDGDVVEGEVMMENKGVMMQKGSYETYSADKLALADKGDVVLFFRASWCPTCRAVDADIRANLGSIPDGVTILDVNYDTETALKQKYGVTYQHTFVQVDASGNQIAKWSGSPTLAALVANIK